MIRHYRTLVQAIWYFRSHFYKRSYKRIIVNSEYTSSFISNIPLQFSRRFKLLLSPSGKHNHLEVIALTIFHKAEVDMVPIHREAFQRMNLSAKRNTRNAQKRKILILTFKSFRWFCFRRFPFAEKPFPDFLPSRRNLLIWGGLSSQREIYWLTRPSSCSLSKRLLTRTYKVCPFLV